MAKRVSSWLALFLLSMSALDILSPILTRGISQNLFSGREPLILFISALFFFLSHGIHRVVLRILQVAILFIIGLIIIFSGSMPGIASPFFLYSFYCLRKYGGLYKCCKAIQIVCVILGPVIIVAASIIGQHDIFNFFIGFSSFFIFYSINNIEVEQNAATREHITGLYRKIGSLKGKTIDLKKAGFSPRQIQIGWILVRDLPSDKELAFDLKISPQTISNYLADMRKKMGVEDRLRLIRKIKWYYIEKGLDVYKQDTSTSKKKTEESEDSEENDEDTKENPAKGNKMKL